MLMIHPVTNPTERGDGLSAYRPIETSVESIANRLERAPVRTLKSREHLFREGEDKANIYRVLEGAFVQYRLLSNGRRQVTGFAARGDTVGLGTGKSHNCSAESSGASKVRILLSNTLHRMAREDSHLGMQLYDAISQELVTAQDLLMTVGKLNAGERVATFLLGLSKRNTHSVNVAAHIDLPMTRCDIADFLGLTTETISRTLTKLSVGNIISRHHGYIRILDAGALEAVASGDLSV